MEKITTAAESFLSSLGDLSNNDQLELRLLKNKLFIAEGFLENLISHYQNWLALNGAGSYTKDKVLNRVFGTENLTLYYVPDGNNCLIGYIANVTSEFELKKGSIPLSNSVPINAKDYLHPKDPSIKTIEGVEIRKPLNQSTQIVVNLGSQKVILSEIILRKVTEILRSSRKVIETYPEIERSLKDALRILRVLLLQSKVVSRSRSQLVPEQYSAEDIELRFFSGNVFVIKGEELKDIFEVRGRGLSALVDSELVYLAEKINLKNIDVFQLLHKDPKVIGKMKITGKWYAIDRRAFKALLEKISLSRFFQGKLAKRYTIKNVLEVLIPVLRNADWIDVSSLGRQQAIESTQKNKPRFELKYTPWTFVTGKNFTIIDFVESGSMLPKRPQK
jgi:hypothetical protein